MGWRSLTRAKHGLGLSDEEVFGQLEKSGQSDCPFLYRYTREQLWGALDRAKILSRIRKLGYPTPQMKIRVDEGLHVLKLELPGEKAALLDLRLNEESRVATGWAGRILGSQPLALLVVQWVSLQHIHGAFTTERPQLPGQSFPGLGAGRRVYRFLWRKARELGKDGLSAFPMYYHNAVYYSEGFSYLDPRKQGELVALKRDLGSLPLHLASEGINRGHLLDGSTGRVVDWNPGEMFASVSRRLRSYFAAREYQSEVKRVARDFSFRLASR
jgi:hypothetical protein